MISTQDGSYQISKLEKKPPACVHVFIGSSQELDTWVEIPFAGNVSHPLAVHTIVNTPSFEEYL